MKKRFALIALLVIYTISMSGCTSDREYKQPSKVTQSTSTITTESPQVEEPTVESHPIETITVNPCIGTPINLWDIPDEYFSAPKRDDPIDSPLSYGAKNVESIPDCKNIKVQVLDRKCSPIGLEYDYIRYGEQKGWVTRRLLTCPASKRNIGCDSAPDSICSYG